VGFGFVKWNVYILFMYVCTCVCMCVAILISTFLLTVWRRLLPPSSGYLKMNKNKFQAISTNMFLCCMVQLSFDIPES